MNCRSTKLWLLQAETLKSAAWPQELAEHVVACTQCAKVARKIRKLENQWREELPVTQETASAKADFLQMLQQARTPKLVILGPPSVPELDVETLPADEPRPTPKPVPIPVPVPSLAETPDPLPISKKKKKKKTVRPPAWHPVRWVAVAATVLLCTGAMTYLLIAPGQTHAASTEVVDRLIDLNLQMTNADAKDRKRLLSEVEDYLLSDLQKAKLTDEEQTFADELLANCRFLAENDDPIEEANLITDLADKIKAREEVATKKGNEKEINKCSFQHKKVMQMGFHQIADRIAQFKTPDGMKKPGYASFVKYDPMKQQQLQKMLEHDRGKGPDFRKMLEGMRKKGPPPGFGHGFGNGPGFGSGKGGPFGPPFGAGRKK